MAVITINLSCELQEAVKVQYLKGNLFSQDVQANKISVAVYDGGSPASISGTVTANIIREDGGTVTATGGTISGNVVSITLPAAAYIVPGLVSIVIKVTASSVTTTIAAVVVNVYQSSTETAIDPGTIIPSVTALVAQIEAAVASIPADYSSLWTSLAPVFSSSASYTPGQYVTNGGVLYVCTTSHTGSWNASHFSAVNVGGELSRVFGAINNGFYHIAPVSNGSFSSSGTYTTNSKRIRTDFIPVKIGDKIVIQNGSLKHACGAWYGSLSSSTIIRNDGSFSANDETIISEINGYYIIVFAKSDITQNISLSDYDGSISFYANQIYKNKLEIDNLIEKTVDHQMMELCEIEEVEASQNIWNPATIISGGGIKANGQDYASAEYCHQRINVTSGDTLYFYKIGDTALARWVCAYDSNGNPVSASGSDTNISSYNVPNGIVQVSLSIQNSIADQFMVFVNNSTTPTSYIQYVAGHERYTATKEFLKNISTGAVIVDVPVYGTTETAVAPTTGAVIANGTIRTDYDTYEYSQKISVSAGDIVKPVGDDGIYFRFVCAYSGTTVVSSAGESTGADDYTVPVGIDGIIVSTLKEKNITAVSIKHQTGTEEHTYPISQSLGKFNWKGNLASGQSVELLGTNVRFNTVWNFTGHITTMGKITLAVKTASGVVKELCSVDSSNLYYRLNDGSIASVAHGLTISEDLQIKIDSPFKVNELGGITICSDGVEYTLDATSYGTDMNGVPYLLSTGAVMTDCAFAWIPKDIDKPIWVFGDSWVSMYESRWTYYIVRDGYTNSWMLNGFAGEDTDEAFESLENLLTIRKPDYIVWLLGMNNGDSNTAVNAVWKKIYDKLVKICSDYAINLILYTVPNTPTINNNFKNAIVRESGYRYIDGASAVGDDGNGNWFTGYEQSASDHNHTSAKGARALYYRILADFPEIAGNGI